jgi:parallel beta-helix repeat protein
LWVKAQSFAVVRSCIAEGNDQCGIEVAEQARPTLEENQCRNNSQCGIAYSGSSGGTARWNICEADALYPIYISHTAQPELEANVGELVRENR